MSSTEQPEHRKQEAEEETTGGAAEDEDTGAEVAPIVKLQEVAVTTGEEDEIVLLDLKCKLYRFDKEGNQWKERGVGTVKLLKHKETQKVRLVMRQSKTLKICANHLVLASTSVQEHTGNDKSCVWHATDFSDGELKEELFCIRLASVENCKTFREKIEEIAESLEKKAEESEETKSATDLLEKLNVGESKDEEGTKEAASASAEVEKDESAQQEKPESDK
ncbi:hypothetical protein PVL29_003992 [Vitis rotundifolia]|uniref:RanBD1 domain-containing protein n=1 Tax=Vitis rotundifolia TaxID=103349 RepID=A0AA39DYZ8_VITRO|nr:hypothetical protein PVL29_003992 [Vitis rotundifolia]